jgi:hypothetical protein
VVEKQAWYVLAVKENHPALYDQRAEYFRWVEEEPPPDEEIDVWRSGCEKEEHGRIEQREVCDRYYMADFFLKCEFYGEKTS